MEDISGVLFFAFEGYEITTKSLHKQCVEVVRRGGGELRIIIKGVGAGLQFFCVADAMGEYINTNLLLFFLFFFSFLLFLSA